MILMLCHALFLSKNVKMSQILSSAAVVIGDLRVNSPALVMSRSLRLSSRLITQFSMSQIYWKTDKPYKDKHIWASTRENLSSGVSLTHENNRLLKL